MGRRQLRYCISCGGTHKRPTGLKCKRTAELEAINRRVLPETSSDSEGSLGHLDDAPGAGAPKEIEKPEGTIAAPDDDRLSRMEALVGQIASVVFKKSADDAPAKSKPRDDTQSDDSFSSRSSSQSRHGRRRSRQNRIFAQSRHVNQGETIQNFDHLMVITFKTLLEMCERGLPLNGLLRHGLTMAEKSASGAYLDRACILYDASVRQRALKLGHAAFGEPVNEDLIRHFSLENARRFDSRPPQGSKKKKNVCFRYNSESGCNAKDCGYAHRCSQCKSEGHSAKDCRGGDRNKASK